VSKNGDFLSLKLGGVAKFDAVCELDTINQRSGGEPPERSKS